jgi:hypothetical protein
MSSLSKKHATAGKTHVTMSLEHMNTCTQLATTISKRIQTLYGKEACQTSTHTACQVQVSRAFRDINYQPPPCIVNRKQNFTVPFQYRPANEQTASLSSHLLDCLVRDLNCGPLAGYTCLLIEIVDVVVICFSKVFSLRTFTQFCFPGKGIIMNQLEVKLFIY